MKHFLHWALNKMPHFGGFFVHHYPLLSCLGWLHFMSPTYFHSGVSEVNPGTSSSLYLHSFRYLIRLQLYAENSPEVSPALSTHLALYPINLYSDYIHVSTMLIQSISPLACCHSLLFGLTSIFAPFIIAFTQQLE